MAISIPERQPFTPGYRSFTDCKTMHYAGERLGMRILTICGLSFSEGDADGKKYVRHCKNCQRNRR